MPGHNFFIAAASLYHFNQLLQALKTSLIIHIFFICFMFIAPRQWQTSHPLTRPPPHPHPLMTLPLSSVGSGLGLGALAVPESELILPSSSEKLLSTSEVAVTVVAILSQIDTVRLSSS